MHTRKTPNPSVEPTASGLRPPAAAHLKRWAPEGEAGCTRCAVVGAGNCALAPPALVRLLPSSRCSRSYLQAFAAGLSVRWRPAHRQLCAKEFNAPVSRCIGVARKSFQRSGRAVIARSRHAGLSVLRRPADGRSGSEQCKHGLRLNFGLCKAILCLVGQRQSLSSAQ